MTNIENRKLQLELVRVTAAKMSMEIQIEEMKLEIERLSGFVLIQIEKENELKAKLGVE